MLKTIYTSGEHRILNLITNQINMVVSQFYWPVVKKLNIFQMERVLSQMKAGYNRIPKVTFYFIPIISFSNFCLLLTNWPLVIIIFKLPFISLSSIKNLHFLCWLWGFKVWEITFVLFLTKIIWTFIFFLFCLTTYWPYMSW